MLGKTETANTNTPERHTVAPEATGDAKAADTPPSRPARDKPARAKPTTPPPPHYKKLAEQLAARLDALPKRPTPAKAPGTNNTDRTGSWFTGLWLTGSWLTGPWLTGPWLTGPWIAGRWLGIGAVAAFLVAVAGGSWVYRSAIPKVANASPPVMPIAGDLAQVLQQERDKANTLARHLDMVWQELRSQAAELAEKAAQTQELGDLRLTLQRTESLSETYHGLLMQERARILELEEQLAARQDSAPAPNPEPVPPQAPAQVPAPVPVLEKPATASPPLADKPTMIAASTPATIALPQTAPEPPSDADVARLMARARTLLEQGNIAAARSFLERAAETRNAAALFALAETYDPAVLSAWGTFGTQGDVAKARDLYTKAFAGGVQQAMERLHSLR
jgi:hypothetical protein